MKITHIASACVLIESQKSKILCDPWLLGNVYYGSWSLYPPISFSLDIFKDVDAVYISHIHPDHLDATTLKKLKAIWDNAGRDVPILIHNYDAKFVKNNIEKLGLKTIELDHGDNHSCEDIDIYIYAADNCNPEICFKFFGCGKMESEFGSTGLDTVCVFTDGEKTILNVNDSPYLLSKQSLDVVKKNHPSIDLLLVGYAGAGCYPQCWEYTDKEKLEVFGQKKKNYFLKMGLDFINHVNPRFYMPFAGTYTLAGTNWELEDYKVVPTLQEALSFYKERSDSSGFLLNSFEHFDLNSESCSAEYVVVDENEKREYAKNVLSKIKYDYEYDDTPEIEEIIELLPAAYNRFENKRKELNFETDTKVLIYLDPKTVCEVSCSGNGYKVLESDKACSEKYVSYKIDTRLLKRILSGPKYAHWNNAEIGSHIQFSRNPEIYERPLYFCMNYFHS